MDFILVLIAAVAMWGVSAALMNWLFETPAPKKRKYIRTADEVHNKIDKL